MYDRKIKPTIEERSLAIRQRSVNKTFLDGQPKDAPSLAGFLEQEKAERERADTLAREVFEEPHRVFLSGNPSVSKIRTHLEENRWGPYGSEDRAEKVRQLFKELLGTEEPFCEHAKTWLESCQWCELIQTMMAKGKDPFIVTELYINGPGWLIPNDELPVRRHQFNTLLQALGLSVDRGLGGLSMGGKRTLLLSAGLSQKMDAIDGYQQNQELIGGKRVRPAGIGRDQDEENEETPATGGTYADTEPGSSERPDDEHRQATLVEPGDGAEVLNELQEAEEVNHVDEVDELKEVGQAESENYDPRHDNDLSEGEE
jgi:hypothetical protein